MHLYMLNVLKAVLRRQLNTTEQRLIDMSTAVDKGVRHIQTDDLRTYLTEYQEKNGSSKVTIDNIRRIYQVSSPGLKMRIIF